MSETLKLIQTLVARGELKVSLHGYEELANDEIKVRDAVSGLSTAVVVEDYPTYPKGPCVLVLQRDGDDQPMHIVWGIPAGQDSPAVLVTGYRPALDKWDKSWRRRLK